MIPPTSGMDESRALWSSQVRRFDQAGRVFRYVFSVRYPESGEPVATEQPCLTLYVEDHEVAAGARGVYRHRLDVEQRAKEVWFEEVGISTSRQSLKVLQ